MSLNYEYGNVKDWKSLTDHEHVALDSLIWATMTIGVPRLDESTFVKFWTRLAAFEAVVRPIRNRSNEQGKLEYFAFTKQELRRFIGLSTNASTLSDSEFMKQLYKRAA